MLPQHRLHSPSSAAAPLLRLLQSGMRTPGLAASGRGTTLRRRAPPCTPTRSPLTLHSSPLVGAGLVLEGGCGMCMPCLPACTTAGSSHIHQPTQTSVYCIATPHTTRPLPCPCPAPAPPRPAGGGARKCIGDTFAITEACVALVVLLRRFRFRLPDPQGVSGGAGEHAPRHRQRSHGPPLCNARTHTAAPAASGLAHVHPSPSHAMCAHTFRRPALPSLPAGGHGDGRHHPHRKRNEVHGGAEGAAPAGSGSSSSGGTGSGSCRIRRGLPCWRPLIPQHHESRYLFLPTPALPLTRPSTNAKLCGNATLFPDGYMHSLPNQQVAM